MLQKSATKSSKKININQVNHLGITNSQYSVKPPTLNYNVYLNPAGLVISLKPHQRYLINTLLWFENTFYTSFPSLNTLAKKVGVEEKTIRRDLKVLASLGLVSSRQRFNTSKVYRLASAFWDPKFAKKIAFAFSELRRRFKEIVHLYNYTSKFIYKLVSQGYANVYSQSTKKMFIRLWTSKRDPKNGISNDFVQKPYPHRQAYSVHKDSNAIQEKGMRGHWKWVHAVREKLPEAVRKQKIAELYHNQDYADAIDRIYKLAGQAAASQLILKWQEECGWKEISPAKQIWITDENIRNGERNNKKNILG